ncbi:TRAP transporter large permease [Spiribacter pallidus]|jgi:tripartite ATP-independent transporter DctM subunit|uniref:TRAP transporter large permease protein n=1 Tax=Spiribacter pallidus TaxID=1987936 RepID=A0ABV3TBW4_9GAMM
MFYDLPEYATNLGWEFYGPLIFIAVLVVLAVPIWVSIGLGTVVMLIWSGALPLSLLGDSLFEGIDAFALIAVPLFILTGDVLVRTGLSARLLDIADAITGGVRSGFGSATVLGCGFFSCISGSDAAGAAAVGRMTIGRLIDEGYPPARACALVASGACTGILIPPSIAYIIIGLVLGVSASTLFVAAVVPGVLVLVSIMLTNAILNRIHGYESSDRRFDWRKLGRALVDGRYALMVPVIILGGIYTGIFTPTEAAAVAVISSLIIGLTQGTLDISDLPDILQSSAKVNGIIVPIIAVSLPFAQTLGALDVAEGFVGVINGITDEPWLIILMMIGMLIVAGCIMEATPNIVILSPLLFPLAQSIGMHEVHFCIMMVTALGVGFITPPLGLNLFVVSGLTGTSVLSIASRALPYVFAMLTVVLLLAFVPQLSLWAVQ